MEMKCRKRLSSFILCMTLIVAMAFGTVGCNGSKDNGAASDSGTEVTADVQREGGELGEGSTQFGLTVTDKDGNDVALMDVIPQPENGYEQIENDIVLEKIKQAVKELPDTERTIIERRYGLDGGEAYTQSQVAGMLGISRSYVSRIEKRAVIKISKNII